MVSSKLYTCVFYTWGYNTCKKDIRNYVNQSSVSSREEENIFISGIPFSVILLCSFFFTGLWFLIINIQTRKIAP